MYQRFGLSELYKHGGGISFDDARADPSTVFPAKGAIYPQHPMTPLCPIEEVDDFDLLAGTEHRMAPSVKHNQLSRSWVRVMMMLVHASRREYGVTQPGCVVILIWNLNFVFMVLRL